MWASLHVHSRVAMKLGGRCLRVSNTMVGNGLLVAIHKGLVLLVDNRLMSVAVDNGLLRVHDRLLVHNRLLVHDRLLVDRRTRSMVSHMSLLVRVH